MLTIVTHRFTRKADILNCEGKFIISKTPIKIASTTIIQKLGSPFHGQISRDATGAVDLVAEMQKHPDALWIRVKAIEADIPNDNGDYFSREEIIKAYKSFEGVPVFTNHENNKVENAKGKVVKAEWDEREGAVYCTMFVDRQANPPLCRAIEEGYVTDVSMGTQVDYSTCSICDKKALTADDYCPHVKTMKGRMVDGKKVFEKNYGLKFIEISVVTDGACKECTIREVLDPESYLSKVADAVETVNMQVLADATNDKQVKVGLFKDGGQAEIQKLNQAMDLLEDVCRAMLDQRQFIDLEFMSKLAEVLADLQHANDELVDQGYGRMGDQGAAGQQMGVPPLPENSGGGMQELAPEGPKPFLTGPTMTGVGTVTEPTNASNGGNVLFSTRIKDLHDKVSKIYEEHKTLTRGGNTSVDKEKANQTIAKLAKIWENPSVKNFKVEVDDDSGFKLAVGSEEIVGLKGGQKVAALKIASLDEDVREKLKTDPNECYGHLLCALKTQYANSAPRMEKDAGYAPTDTKAQQQNTMEAQLREQSKSLPLHPRVDEIRESITEDQLKAKREGYEYHNRQDKPRDAITEGQLKEGEWQGYENFKVQDQPRDETMELQLRNEKWKGNVTPAGKEGEWVAGVKDQHQQITEGQLNDWKDSDKGHNPTDRITEKQLADDSENWGRRIASKEDAKKALAATLKAIVRTAGATGATPTEILAFVKDMTSCVNNRAAAEKAVTALAKHKETRQAMLRRAKFHGVSKTASQSEVADYLLGSMADQGMCGQVGCQVLEKIAGEKNAYNNIEQAIKAGHWEKDEEEEFINASSADYLREALAEAPKKEEVKVVLDRKAIKADEGTEKYAEAAYELATKEATKAGIKVTEKVHVANLKDDKVEVLMFGVKEEKQASAEKPVEKTAETDLQNRKEARKQLVAQVGGDMAGGMGAGGAGGMAGGMPGAGGGTTMPPTVAPGGDPTAGAPPVAGLGETAAPPGDEKPSEGEALPPFTMCPVCHSENVDFRHGEWDCKDCGADGTGEIVIRVKSWPGVIEDTEPKGQEEGIGGLEEGGLGEMGGGEGMEMPPVGLAAKFKVTPEMVKIAGNKPIGSLCPHCGSIKVKLAMKNGSGTGTCEICKNTWKVETYVSQDKEIWAEIKWDDVRTANLVKERRLAVKKAAQENKKLATKKAELETALRKNGLVAKFAKADISGKAEIIATLADKGLLAK